MLSELIAAGALVSQQLCAVQWNQMVGTSRCDVRARREHQRWLQRAFAGVIIEFELPSTEPTYNAPAMTLCKLADLCVGHLSKNSQLRRLGDHVLRFT